MTPRTSRLWRDTGLLGYDAAGEPDPSWRGRNDGRNAAFTDLLFSSGLRPREGGCLLTLEVPDAAGGHGYREGTVAGAVAKRRQRMLYASAAALRRVAGYVATTRADAVRRARRHRRYEQVSGKLVVTGIGHGARPRIAWPDEHGRAADAPLGAISPDDRMRLFTEGVDGMEPQVSLRWLRRTVQVLIRREPAQNSEQTHESAYVLRDPATLPEVEQVTAQGLTDAVSHARATVKMRMLLDTATGACLDFSNSPSGLPGLCTASFLDCLACPNAVATRRHLSPTRLAAPRPGRVARHRTPGGVFPGNSSCYSRSCCVRRSVVCGPDCRRGCAGGEVAGRWPT